MMPERSGQSESNRLGDSLRTCDSIELAALIELAELQTRSARKYLVDLDVVSRLAAEVGDDLAVLQINGGRSFGYETVYFDTPDRQLYLATAHRRPRRFKVRSRRYSSGDSTMLEVKAKNGRGATVKHRSDHPTERRSELTPVARRWISQVIGAHAPDSLVDALAPSLATEFCRATAVERSGAARYTFDEQVVCRSPDGRSVRLDQIVLECKSEQGPSRVDRWLWRQGIRPTKFSKYCVGLASIENELPSNYWYRTMQRYVSA